MEENEEMPQVEEIEDDEMIEGVAEDQKSSVEVLKEGHENCINVLQINKKTHTIKKKVFEGGSNKTSDNFS